MLACVDGGGSSVLYATLGRMPPATPTSAGPHDGHALEFRNARVFTGEGFTEPASLHVVDGMITGPEHPSAGTAETMDLDGRYLMPGFIESHAHPGMLGMSLMELDLRPSAAPSVEAIVGAVAQAARTAAPGEWVRGSGWEETFLAEGRGPTRNELDAVSGDVPVVLTRTCRHMLVANTAALRASGIDEDVADPPGGRFVRDEQGRLTGLVQEKAMDSIAAPAYSDEEWDEAFRRAQDAFISWGVTTAHDMSTLAPHLRYYSRAGRSGQLRIRFRPWLWALSQAGMEGVLDHALGAGISSGLGDDRMRIQGMKFMLDGSVGGRTAAVSCAFEGTEDTGLLYIEDETLLHQLRRAVRGGLRLAVHGIGERALDQALGALGALDTPEEREFLTTMRNRIEHCALPLPAHLDALAEWNLIASSSVAFVYHLGDSYLRVLGPERVKRAYPHRSFLDHGIVAPGNSDAPVVNGNPWEGIYAATTRTTSSGVVLDREQNITLAEAIRAYTRDAAYGSFEEDRLGTLAPGAHADLQILDRDPFAVEPADLLTLAPVAVYSAGTRIDG